MSHDLYETYPFRWRPYTTKTKYDALQPLDAAVWTECIKQFPALYKTVAYNVPVGLVGMPPPNQRDNIPADWIYLTSPKVDCVCFSGEALVVVEVKPQLNPEAIGQVMVYKSLFIKRWQPELPVKTQIATMAARPEYQYFCDINGIDLLIPEAPEALKTLLNRP
jgi:hypothetical protein